MQLLKKFPTKTFHKFNKRYYTSGNYRTYLKRSKKYESLAQELKHTGTLGAFTKTILDFGSGVGFLTNSLNDLGYDCLGYDISNWAVSYGQERFKANLTTNYAHIIDKNYDYMLALDVLEHMDIEEINLVLSEVLTSYLLVRIPVCEHEGKDFVLDVSRADKTHITCLTKAQWNELFERQGFYLGWRLHLENIWDSSGVFCAVYIFNDT